METIAPLVEAALEKIRTRLPDAEFAVAAAIELENGQILTSIGFDNFNAAANLCAETGALCEAFNLDRAVVASVCVSTEAGKDGYQVLAPCGICQERLALWGPEVLVAVSDTRSSEGWSMKPLAEVNPFYWAAQFTENGAWPSTAEHSE